MSQDVEILPFGPNETYDCPTNKNSPTFRNVCARLTDHTVARIRPIVAAKSTWVMHPRPRPNARFRLFCFPHAGGGASIYRAWAALLPPTIELCAVQLPGRENRFRESPAQQMGTLMADLPAALASAMDRPFGLFGYSMGGLIAFELARRLRYHPHLKYLFVAACAAPTIARTPALHLLPDGEFVTAVQRRYEAIPQIILEDEALLTLFLPTLRADFTLVETYAYTVGQPLPCPLSVWGGRDDEHVSTADLAAWGAETATAFRCETVAGGHFFLFSDQTEAARLAQWVHHSLEQVRAMT